MANAENVLCVKEFIFKHNLCTLLVISNICVSAFNLSDNINAPSSTALLRKNSRVFSFS